MAFNYGAWSAPKGYDTNVDVLGRFAQGHEFGKGIADERGAQDALGDYVKSLYLGAAPQQASRSAPPTLVNDSVNATTNTAPWMQDAVNDSAYLNNLRSRESGGNDGAKNPNSSATGRYQITDGTWQGLMKSHPELGLTADGRLDPAQQDKAVRVLTSENASALKARGLPVNPTTLYASHFLGSPQATQVLGYADNTPLVSALPPEVIQANPQLQNMTVGDFKAWAGQSGRNQSGGYQAPIDVSGAPAQSAPASGNGLPPRDVMLKLFQNPQTRGFAADLVKASQSADPAMKPTDDMREYAFAKSQGYEGSFADWQKTNKAGVTVNTGDNSGAFTKKADELAAARFDGYVEAGNGAANFMGDLRALTDLSRNITTGKRTEILNALGPYAEAVGVKIEGLDDSQAYDAIIARMAPAMRMPGSGASSDFDAKQFLKSLPSLGNTPEGNRIINEVFQGIQERKMRAAEIAGEALSGTKTWQGADAEIRALGDPYTAFKTFKKSTGDNAGGVGSLGAETSAPEGVDPTLWEVMTPEERAAWQ